MRARRARRRRPRRRRGPYGETDDKVVTNAGFILIVGFPILILILLADRVAALDKRKDRAARQGAPRRATARRRRRARRLVARPRLRVRWASATSGAAPPLVTIDRPERRNAVDGPTAEALLEGFERFAPTTARACWSSPARATRRSARGRT